MIGITLAEETEASKVVSFNIKKESHVKASWIQMLSFQQEVESKLLSLFSCHRQSIAQVLQLQCNSNRDRTGTKTKQEERKELTSPWKTVLPKEVEDRCQPTSFIFHPMTKSCVIR